MRPQSFFRNLLLLIFLNLLIKPFWLLGIDRTVQNITGPEAYGLYYALFSLSFYTQILLDPGLHTFNNREIAGNPLLLSKYLASFVPLKIILSGIYLGATLLGGVILGYNSYAIYLLFWIAIIQVLSSLLLYFRSNLAGLHLFRTDSVFSVLDRTLMILICGILIWGPVLDTFHIEWFVYAQAAALAMSCIAAAIVVSRKSSLSHFPGVRFIMLWVVLRKSYPYALLALLMTLYSRTDSLMLERLLPDGSYQAGIYASGYRLMEAANMIAFLFATLLLPLFARRIARKESVGDISQPSMKLLMVPALALTLGSFFFREEIMNLLYTDTTAYSGWVFGWLMLSFPMQCMIYIYGTLLTANGSMRFLNKISLISVLTNIALNFILIPQYEAPGAVMATVVTQSATAIGITLYAHKIFDLRWPVGDLWRFGLFLAVILPAFALGQLLQWHWAVNLTVLMFFTFTFAVIIGLLKPRWLAAAIHQRTEV
ncbi:MAG: polysaccharide biosynthesis C-terminal domain-containing protein [Bacteroidota bacterium]|nr:polysaccharide biosynthesis C-terminal domain-containing protein [Bacteroidota bacterium]